MAMDKTDIVGFRRTTALATTKETMAVAAKIEVASATVERW
jgi:hypothetical protein